MALCLECSTSPGTQQTVKATSGAGSSWQEARRNYPWTVMVTLMMSLAELNRKHPN